MKLAVQCLCFLHFALLSFGLDTHISLSRRKAFHSDAGYVNQDRRRPLFARREQYEQQRIHEPKKSRIVSPPQNDIAHPKVVPNPMMPKCSQLGQSCVPLYGCCDSCAMCHCRFFNAICFCRKAEKAKSRCGNKTPKNRKAKKSEKHNPKHALGQ
ncbi:uncharacterized protein FYW61_016253 [Anableps anableps]